MGLLWDYVGLLCDRFCYSGIAAGVYGIIVGICGFIVRSFRLLWNCYWIMKDSSGIIVGLCSGQNSQ